ncbi:MAG TPA: pilin [Candidatus Doudnabacteria bacterium]|nr:pilin [Candidatus Doudnabacteria bacterium]
MKTFIVNLRNITFYTLAIAMVFTLIPNLANAQSRLGPIAEGQVLIQLFKNGTRSSDTSIPVDKVQEYSLVMVARAFNTGTSQSNFWQGEINIFRSDTYTVSTSTLFARENIAPGAIIEKEHRFRAGTAPQGLVNYVVYNCSQPTISQCPKATQTITYTAAGTTPGQTPPINPSEQPTPGTTPGTTPGQTPLPPVNTDVGIKVDTSFDTVLGTFFNPLEDDRPEEIIVRIINILLTIAGVLAVIFIIVGGLMMVTSAGNENRLKNGKQTLIYAVLGLILTLLSFSIVAIIQTIIAR